ncbi:MAG TPA: hypothetical protein VHF07_01145 [Nitrospiraceae bacterium]|nr:hypothetical protein [Nitrospiraceae bacterium]
MSKKPSYLADFDSASAMLVALAEFLDGRDFPLLGTLPFWMTPILKALGAMVNALPNWGKEQVYIWSGWLEAISQQRLGHVRGDELARWVVNLYPDRLYPAVAIGSSNGAAVHLWSALGIPWLPQTFLIPVSRSGVHPDEPADEVAWSRKPAQTVLAQNPDWALHHMHDPVQDRLMVRRMSYFRMKKTRLGPEYEAFLDRHLEAGGTIFLVDCRLSWPVTRLNERHVFQFGALGGATVEEMHQGGPRVADYLKRHGSPYSAWRPPAADAVAPEAEWGFDQSLGQDVLRYAQRRRLTVRRISFEQPEAMSPLVADLYRWWNERRGIPDRRLLVESFILMEPYWTIGTGCVPFWMVFNTEASLAAVEQFLDQRQFEEIYMMLFSHGVESIGLAPIAHWRRVIDRATRHGTFIGIDPHAFPRDFAVFVRYHDALLKEVTARHPRPPALTIKELDDFLTARTGTYDVEWTFE